MLGSGCCRSTYNYVCIKQTCWGGDFLGAERPSAPAGETPDYYLFMSL